MIEFEDVHFSYKSSDDLEEERSYEKEVLKGISFTVREGEFVCILGSNGSGKTTLGKLMNSLLLPSSGVIKVDGISPDSEENIYRIRQLAGMVFQDPSRQLVASTIEDELAFGPENLGIDPEEIMRRINWALKILKLEKLRFREPHYLSGGQTQRIAIAGVLVMHPKYIIMDEPTAMLDPEGRRSVLEAVDFLRTELGIAVIYITHHMEEVMAAQRVFAVHEGSLIFEGSPAELFSDSELLDKLGLDVPDIVKLICRLKEAGYDLPYCSDWKQAADALFDLLS